jgi:stage II sporulation protein D
MNLKTLIFSGLLVASSPMFYQPQLSAFEVPQDLSLKMKPATVKVLLQDNSASVILEVKGKYQICNPTTHFVLSSGSSFKASKITHHSNGMKWGEIIPGTFQMRIVPLEADTTILVNGIQYRGCVDIYDNQGKFTVINEVDVESFLRSSLSTTFTQEMDPEVLNAIAIVARTNVYHMLSKKPSDLLYHVTCQEAQYRGHGASLINTGLEKAISETRHAIMTYHKAPFAATWTENSAGKTADYASIFRKNTPSPSGVEIPLAESDRLKHGWSFSMSKDQLAHIAHMAHLTKIALFSEKKSGKVYALKISNEDSSSDVDFFTLQQVIGENKLKSNDFTIDVKGEKITFKGYGQGHGTGLCLYTASLMAHQGADAARILATFFPQTNIEKLRSISPPKSKTTSGPYLK